MEELNPTLEKNNTCALFTNVNTEKQEFYSPGYNGIYPANTDCYLIIKGRFISNNLYSLTQQILKLRTLLFF